jgi:isopentenyl diphosphate isomerase/L-lactate dehydrogenase-like FMN-dependent dehydrogenase
MKTLWDLSDYRDAALDKLGPGLADYIQKTAGEGKTCRSNILAFCYYSAFSTLHPNVVDIPQTNVRILGRELATPVLIAPTAWHGMFTPKGENATSNAARNFGTNYVVSSFSTYDFDQIAGCDAASNPLTHAWYQLLMYKDLSLMKSYIDKATNAGCSAIVITIDALTGCSMCKADPSAPPVVFPVHKLPLFPEDPALPYGTLDEYYQKYMPGTLNWNDVRDIVSYTKVPVVLKGVLTVSDVRKAIEVGVKAVVISNHGGRQNDTLPPTLDVLTLLPSDLREQIEIYLDGGIRSGNDVFKALALGAKAVFIGRPALYGLAVNGEEGLTDVLRIFTDELRESMRRSGCETLADLTPDRLARL